MDGISAAQAIHSKFGIPCIFLSAFPMGEQLERAKLAEPLGYLGKPFLEYEMRDAIAAAISVI
jgi:CheY-like chemotaxis protein